MIIGINGRYRSGKDTVAKIIADRYENVEIYHFADKLKDSAAAALGISREQMEFLKENVNHLYTLDPDPTCSEYDTDQAYAIPYFNMRSFLQRYGTEAHRQIFGDDFWIRATLDGVIDAEKLILIPDTRFPNEAEAVKARGGIVVRVSRSATDNHGDTHASEQNIDDWAEYWIPNEADLHNLEIHVGAFIEWLQNNYDVSLREKITCS